VNDLRQLWNSLPHKAAFAVVFGSWIALFHLLGCASSADGPSLFNWLYVYYQTPTAAGLDSGDALCPWIPFLAAVLFWLKRSEIVAVSKAPWTPALGLIGLGLALHYCGFVVQQSRVSIVGFLLGGFGVLGLVWGRAFLKIALFPWFLLLFAIPVDAYTDALTFHLRLLATHVSVFVCHDLLGMGLIQQGTVIHYPASAFSPGFTFEVAAACSGIRSASVTLLITLVFAYLNLRSFWRRLIIVLSAVPLALFGNIFRLVVVFMVADTFGQAAGKRIETNFGFVTYAGAMIGVFVLGKLLREHPVEPGPDNPPVANPESLPA
jgi:exosortase